MQTKYLNNQNTEIQEVKSVTNPMTKTLLAVVASTVLLSTPAVAQYGDSGGASSGSSSSSSSTSGSSEFGSYIDVMFDTQLNQDDDVQTVTTGGGGLLGGGTSKTYDPVLDKAHGASVLFGFRRKGWYGFEFGLGYSKDGESDVQKNSAMFNTLFYPFENDLYLKLALGVTRYVEYPIGRSSDPIPDGDDDFITVNYGAGVGYVFPFELGERSFGIRAEAVYLVGDRFLERENDFEEDIRAPGTLEEIQLNIGIRFPL